MPTPACESEVTENYDNGTAASAPTGSYWDYSQDIVSSTRMLFGQVLNTSSGRVLVVGDQAYPGEKSGGVWTFSYDSFTDGILKQEHASGYLFETSGLDGREIVISADMKSASMSGSWALTTTTDLTYTESDEWDVSVGVISGQTPAGAYLLDSMGVGVMNNSNSSDCSGEFCSLQVVEACTATTTFTASKVGSLDETAYSGLSDAGQQPLADN
jgi:hypothetical protein